LMTFDDLSQTKKRNEILRSTLEAERTYIQQKATS
jgi:hypothetical protein